MLSLIVPSKWLSTKGYYLSTSGSTPRDTRTSTIFFITAACLHGWTEACFPANKWGWSSIVTCINKLCYAIASRQPVPESNRRQLHCFTHPECLFPSRLILDNVLLVCELTHIFFQIKRSGSTGYAALKLDMSKAYNNDGWHLLCDMMIKVGFWLD